jgi:hypothetical protein
MSPDKEPHDYLHDNREDHINRRPYRHVVYPPPSRLHHSQSQ